MKVFKSGYFDDFRCLAGACPDSCCQEWEVDVDDAAARRYFGLSGELGERLRQKLKRADGGYYLEITDRRCPMWREDGLCQIQAELGHEGLCQVCREYPRLTHDYGDFVEKGLELSCPEAARLMLTLPEKPRTVEETHGGEAPEYDREDMELLLRTREQAWELLRDYPVPEALALLLVFAHRVQEALDGGELEFDPREDLELARQVAQPFNWEEFRDFYLGLEILTPRWRELLSASDGVGQWNEMHRSMARYGVERYWLQAVSDLDLVCRVKLIVSGCLLVRCLGADTVSVAQLYAKEIENSGENTEAVLDGAYTHPALTDARLLGGCAG